MKTYVKILMLSLLAILLVFTASVPVSLVQASAPSEAITTTNTTLPLSPEEEATLLAMRVEEKLAHDVYVTLYDLWNMPIFLNISQSESRHTASIAKLLSAYNIPDPVDDSQIGVFEDPEIQKLYTDLIAQGSVSLADAYVVGATIEEMDIIDLEEALAETDNVDLERVYNNLKNGSIHHLSAFSRAIENQTGTDYIPRLMTTEEYNQLTSSRGNRGQGKQR
ncbi:MAG TPA: DUF2202 domain-containing protein [Anaerolineaceae bacterium]|jgi:hypothetical protein|nr:DUF2202 domain-containing protein [Anaerolineaceae bacterium]